MLPIFSKIFEKVVFKQLCLYLEQNNTASGSCEFIVAFLLLYFIVYNLIVFFSPFILHMMAFFIADDGHRPETF